MQQSQLGSGQPVQSNPPSSKSGTGKPGPYHRRPRFSVPRKAAYPAARRWSPRPRPAVAGATIVVPLGTLLSEELKISVDGGKARVYPFRFCSMAGCFAQVGLTQADVNAFKAGVTANL